MVKMRVIAHQKSGEPVYGLTVPKKEVLFFDNTHFTKVYRSGTALIFESGTKFCMTEKEIKAYQFEDVLI